MLIEIGTAVTFISGNNELPAYIDAVDEQSGAYRLSCQGPWLKEDQVKAIEKANFYLSDNWLENKQQINCTEDYFIKRISAVLNTFLNRHGFKSFQNEQSIHISQFIPEEKSKAELMKPEKINGLIQAIDKAISKKPFRKQILIVIRYSSQYSYTLHIDI